jgi:hypothetical protein
VAKKTDDAVANSGGGKATGGKLAVAAAAAVDPASNGPGRYRVTLGALAGEFDARDRDEAWALFCDEQKHWPSPNYSRRTIEKVPSPKA